MGGDTCEMTRRCILDIYGELEKGTLRKKDLKIFQKYYLKQ